MFEMCSVCGAYLAKLHTEALYSVHTRRDSGGLRLAARITVDRRRDTAAAYSEAERNAITQQRLYVRDVSISDHVPVNHQYLIAFMDTCTASTPPQYYDTFYW